MCVSEYMYKSHYNTIPVLFKCLTVLNRSGHHLVHRPRSCPSNKLVLQTLVFCWKNNVLSCFFFILLQFWYRQTRVILGIVQVVPGRRLSSWGHTGPGPKQRNQSVRLVKHSSAPRAQSVSALCRVAAAPWAPGATSWNCCDVVGTGLTDHTPWWEDRRSQEPGERCPSCKRAKKETAHPPG